MNEIRVYSLTFSVVTSIEKFGDFLHSPSEEIKCILLQIFVCENLAKFPPKIQPRIDFD
jgi:hypothetical protein